MIAERMKSSVAPPNVPKGLPPRLLHHSQVGSHQASYTVGHQLLPGQLHPSQANMPVRSVLQAHQQLGGRSVSCLLPQSLIPLKLGDRSGNCEPARPSGTGRDSGGPAAEGSHRLPPIGQTHRRTNGRSPCPKVYKIPYTAPADDVQQRTVPYLQEEVQVSRLCGSPAVSLHFSL